MYRSYTNVRKSKKNAYLKLESISGRTDLSSVLDQQTGKVKDKKKKYKLDELFDETPVFDEPCMNFNDNSGENIWGYIANDILSPNGKITKMMLSRRMKAVGNYKTLGVNVCSKLLT